MDKKRVGQIKEQFDLVIHNGEITKTMVSYFRLLHYCRKRK